MSKYDETNGTTIVKRIDEVLKNQNKNRNFIVKSLNLKSNTMTNWSTRGTIPNVVDMLCIADYLNVSVEWLVFGEEGALTSEEKKLLAKWKELSDEEKKEVENIINYKIELKKREYEAAQKANTTA